jgi:hypothetical protein
MVGKLFCLEGALLVVQQPLFLAMKPSTGVLSTVLSNENQDITHHHSMTHIIGYFIAKIHI